jgi:uncharacterized protein YndB with AHSA1/START domain
MAIASSELVEREIRIDAPPSVVFEFLTDPAKMVRWMGTEAVLEPWPGGRYYVNVNGHEGVSGKVLEIIPERRLLQLGLGGRVATAAARSKHRRDLARARR